ncbi:MAG: polysaccharide biosynthesis protein [Bacteroidales bacterium]|nr:polysaccharide biosynthesis protein [Bacteroidales bacterium]
MILENRNTPRWIILAFDIFLILVSAIVAYLLRFNFKIPADYLQSLKFIIPFILIVRTIGFVLGKTYVGIVRFTGSRDAEYIFIVLLSGSTIFVLSNLLGKYIGSLPYFIPFSIVVIELLVSSFLMISYRLIVKSLFQELASSSKEKVNVAIYGTGELASITKRTFDRDAESKLRVVAFFSADPKKAGHKLENVIIYKSENLEKVIEKQKIQQFIFTKEQIPFDVKNRIIEICLLHNIEIKTLPDVKEWINGELSLNQIKKYKIEDLLERDVIKLDIDTIKKDVLNKVVMVTGAAGSIGSEIVVQLVSFKPQLIILFDNAETPLYEIDIKLREKYHFQDFKLIVGDIRNRERVTYILNRYQPKIIYHAAALKHVPLMEINPVEAVSTNVFGTKVLAEEAIKAGVEKFIMVSTDKAVNPTNVMGATKRVAEIFTQAQNSKAGTRFIATRFGNVLGSNGSVIPRFREQIEAGGPLTLTDPEVTRFFMTIPEACQLVLEAGSLGQGGEVFMFDMGKSVKIIDLAKKMIKLSGLVLGKDIQIVFTGLRPGEKLFEELNYKDENHLPTPHKKIMIAKVNSYSEDEIQNRLDALWQTLESFDNYQIVKQLKQIIPEYISNNSPYEVLDQ